MEIWDKRSVHPFCRWSAIIKDLVFSHVADQTRHQTTTVWGKVESSACFDQHHVYSRAPTGGAESMDLPNSIPKSNVLSPPRSLKNQEPTALTLEPTPDIDPKTETKALYVSFKFWRSHLIFIPTNMPSIRSESGEIKGEKTPSWAHELFWGVLVTSRGIEIKKWTKAKLTMIPSKLLWIQTKYKLAKV